MRKIFLSILSILFPAIINAQSGTNSPYSQFGLGVLSEQSTGFNRGMNGLSTAMRESNQVNYGNPASYSFAINVVDKNPPEIVVDTTAVSAKLGDTITVRKCTVTDDMSAEDKVTVLITVTTPDLTIYSVEETFEITKAGKYTVTYYAYDEANNFTIVSYDVNA